MPLARSLSAIWPLTAAASPSGKADSERGPTDGLQRTIWVAGRVGKNCKQRDEEKASHGGRPRLARLALHP